MTSALISIDLIKRHYKFMQRLQPRFARDLKSTRSSSKSTIVGMKIQRYLLKLSGKRSFIGIIRNFQTRRHLNRDSKEQNTIIISESKVCSTKKSYHTRASCASSVIGWSTDQTWKTSDSDSRSLPCYLSGSSGSLERPQTCFSRSRTKKIFDLRYLMP